MLSLRCSIQVKAGIIPGEAQPELTRTWEFTKEDLDNPPKYVDDTGAAMNYAMSLQNPQEVNWVKLEWVWY